MNIERTTIVWDNAMVLLKLDKTIKENLGVLRLNHARFQFIYTYELK